MKRHLLILAVTLVTSLAITTEARADPFIGEIRMFGGNFAPRGWALCDGQLLPISANSSLFSILGTTFGGDGRTTFGLPDLRGRLAMHPGTGPGLTPRRLGAKGGSETETLTTQQIPAHNHRIAARSAGPKTRHPENAVLARRTRTYSPDVADVLMAEQAVTATGGGQAHNNIPPFQAVNYIIALQGTYPSRN